MEEIMDEEDNRNNDDNSSNRNDVAPALIAVHPFHISVAVAIASELRVFDLKGNCSVTLKVDSGGSLHHDLIRAIQFGANGKLFVSAGDDKLVKIWKTDSWHCINTVNSEKRVSAVAISNDGHYVCFADKFGVVYVVDLQGLDEDKSLINRKATTILAHYCSIITSLEFSPDGKFVISADRDHKIRVTVFPKKPLAGAHEIQSFCLGHTEFVSCLAFAYSPDCPRGYLVSGGGDSTVRSWDMTFGTLLSTCEVGTEAGSLESNKREEDICHAVTCICTTSNGTSVAVAVQGLQGVILLNCDLSNGTLSTAKVVPIGGGAFIPTCLASSLSSDFLWMVFGVSSLSGVDSPSLLGVRVLSLSKKSATDATADEPMVLEDKEIPGGAKLLEKLQGSVSIEEKLFPVAAEAMKAAMRNLLTKKQYPAENREFRKRGRNDRKFKQ
ncbi:WD40 repeat [Dillenia turbinata]|uniref:tRNA (guanine-N(7)-)-methyltransferase non-catalytic subunit n=1 Tax=Dillenia turbinata TaxID=194707 RepID=A0AAN8VPD5_9MAGN